MPAWHSNIIGQYFGNVLPKYYRFVADTGEIWSSKWASITYCFLRPISGMMHKMLFVHHGSHPCRIYIYIYYKVSHILVCANILVKWKKPSLIWVCPPCLKNVTTLSKDLNFSMFYYLGSGILYNWFSRWWWSDNDDGSTKDTISEAISREYFHPLCIYVFAFI